MNKIDNFLYTFSLTLIAIGAFKIDLDNSGFEPNKKHISLF